MLTRAALRWSGFCCSSGRRPSQKLNFAHVVHLCLTSRRQILNRQSVLTQAKAPSVVRRSDGMQAAVLASETAYLCRVLPPFLVKVLKECLCSETNRSSLKKSVFLNQTRRQLQDLFSANTDEDDEQYRTSSFLTTHLIRVTPPTRNQGLSQVSAFCQEG